MNRWMMMGCLMMALGGAAAADEARMLPAGTGGTVTIPLNQFMAMTHPTPQHPSNGAPMAYILASGSYRLAPQAHWMQVDGEISLRLYQGGWVEVPLMADGAVVSSATLDGAPLPLYQKDDKYTFVARGVGPHVVRIRYNLPTTAAGSTTSLSAKLPLTSVSTLSMALPATHLRLASSPSVPLTAIEKNGRTIVDASIPFNTDQDVTLSWTSEAANPLLHGKQNHEKPLIQAHTDMLVTVSDKTVKSHCRIDCSILRNETDRLSIDVPADADVVDLQCAHLGNYNVTDEKGYRRVTILMSEPVSGDQVVTLALEQPLAAVNGTFNAATVAVEGAERVKGSIGVETTGGIDVSLADQQELRAIDVKELPADLTAMATSPLVLAFEYHQPAYRLALASQKGEELPVLTATIDTAQGLTLVTPEGRTVTRMTYTVRNNLKQYLTFRMPAGATIWSAYVNGEPVKPVKTTDGAIKLPLLRSQGSGDGMSTFPAELTFVTDTGRPTLVGQETMTAPECDVPISQMSWSVYLPKTWDAVRFGGSMQVGSDDLAAVPVPPMGMAREEPEIAMAPAGDKTISRLEVEAKAQNVPAPAPPPELSDMVTSTHQGAFPVRVFVPEVGQVYRFSSLMVAKESPSVVITYSDRKANTAAEGLALFLALLAGWKVSRRLGLSGRLLALRHRLHPVEPAGNPA